MTRHRKYFLTLLLLACPYQSDGGTKQKLPSESHPVVFLGDSITAGWDLDASFPGKPYINKGIGGEGTAQMLARMQDDVIDLAPAVLVLLGGGNDLARRQGPEVIHKIEENIRKMAELATAHQIKVVLCSLTPGRAASADILSLNKWMKDYAARSGAVYCDYFSVLADDTTLRNDGRHPNNKGYALMAPVVERAIAQALKRR